MKLNNEKLKRLVLQLAGINNLFMEAIEDDPPWDDPQSVKPDSGGMDWEAITEDRAETIPLDSIGQQYLVPDYDVAERLKKAQILGSMCGRWTTGVNRCGVEISRAGEHFILTYLKRNGYPTDERYVLIWMDEDVVYYYGYCDRITVLALNTQTDTLMISPGRDYTRMEDKK